MSAKTPDGTDETAEKPKRPTLRLKFPPKLPDPINLFLDVAVGLDGSLIVGDAPSRAGDFILGRVILDTIFVVASCASGVALGERAGPVRADVINEL